MQIYDTPKYLVIRSWFTVLLLLGAAASWSLAAPDEARFNERLRTIHERLSSLALASRSLGMSEGLAAVEIDGKWGYMNQLGDIVIRPVYDDVWRFREGMAVVRSGNLYGFVDSEGTLCIEPQYAYVFSHGFSDGVACVNIGGKERERTGPFWTPIPDGGIWIFIDKQGKKCFPIEREGPMKLSHDGEGIWALDVDGWQFVDREGKSLGFSYASIGRLKEGLQVFRPFDAKYGYRDHQGRVAIRPAFDDADDFSEGLAAVGFFRRFKDPEGVGFKDPDGVEWPRGRIDYRYIDGQGNVQAIGTYASAKRFMGGRAVVSRDRKLFGQIDRHGNVVVPFRFAHIGSSEEELATATMPGGRWGYIDRDGNWAIEPQFHAAFPFAEGLAPVLMDEGWRYIDVRGVVVGPTVPVMAKPAESD